MRLHLAAGIVLLCGPVAPPALAARPIPCVPPDQAAAMLNKDVCVSAHVFNVVQSPDGTRFLDLCSPETPDERCRFTIVSLKEDREFVGDLAGFRDTDVNLRGKVESIRGRSGILLSHERQFRGGPPRFKPNPRLAQGFDASDGRPPLADPNLRGQGSARSFMNSRDREKLPGR